MSHHLKRCDEIFVYQDSTTAYVSADIEPQKPLKGLIQHVSYDSHPIVYYIITEYIPFDYDIDPPVTYRSTSPETFDPNNIQIDENLTPWEIYDS